MLVAHLLTHRDTTHNPAEPVAERRSLKGAVVKSVTPLGLARMTRGSFLVEVRAVGARYALDRRKKLKGTFIAPA